MYARGMTVRAIQGYLAEMYGTEVSPDFISKVTDEVIDESPRGRAGHSSRCIRSFSSMRCGDDAVVRTRRSISHWQCCPMVRATCSESGSNRPKAPSSG